MNFLYLNKVLIQNIIKQMKLAIYVKCWTWCLAHSQPSINFSYSCFMLVEFMKLCTLIKSLGKEWINHLAFCKGEKDQKSWCGVQCSILVLATVKSHSPDACWDGGAMSWWQRLGRDHCTDLKLSVPVFARCGQELPSALGWNREVHGSPEKFPTEYQVFWPMSWI